MQGAAHDVTLERASGCLSAGGGGGGQMAIEEYWKVTYVHQNAAGATQHH